MEAKTFDIFEMAQGTTYPEDKVAIYFDQATAYKIAQIDAKLNGPEKYIEDTKELDKEREKLMKKLNASRVYIHAQGIPTRQITKIIEDVNEELGEDNENPLRTRKIFVEYALAHLRKAVAEDGSEQSFVGWDYDKMDTWIQSLPQENAQRIDGLILKLIMTSDNFENAEVNSDFL